MVFSSIHFLLYFLPICLLIYFFLPRGWKNGFALLASILFYAWGAPKFIVLVGFSLVVDFYLVQLFDQAIGKLRKILFRVSVSINVLLLLVFKYFNFFQSNVNSLFDSLGIAPWGLLHIALPIGISFITFQKISYLIDCYDKKVDPQKSLVNYALYILLFPQLIAGPIVRYKEIAAQLIDRSHQDNIDYKLSGFFRFIIGLAKKVLIADTLGIVVDQIFAIPGAEMGMLMAWIGIVAYSFQIYFDFSGYSDMAIGIARMMGFVFPENFNFPYISKNITEFWRRWHITLSNWMRDYLYIPLGGNQVSTQRLYFNLCTVFLLSGLWHGAAWTFIFWGAFHGLFLIFDRLFLIKLIRPLGTIPQTLITFLIVLIGWVFFRAEDFSYALNYLGSMFSFNNAYPEIYISSKFWFVFIIASLFSFIGLVPKMEILSMKWYLEPGKISGIILKASLCLVLGMLCLIHIYSADFNPFIYFRF